MSHACILHSRHQEVLGSLFSDLRIRLTTSMNIQHWRHVKSQNVCKSLMSSIKQISRAQVSSQRPRVTSQVPNLYKLHTATQVSGCYESKLKKYTKHFHWWLYREDSVCCRQYIHDITLTLNLHVNTAWPPNQGTLQDRHRILFTVRNISRIKSHRP